MSDTDGLRYIKVPLNNGSDEIPALGFGTLIPDPIATKEATTTALEMGFRADPDVESVIRDYAADEGIKLA